MSIAQFDAIVGAYVSIDGHAFNGVAFFDPSLVSYAGPVQFRAVSGRPYLQGPATWVCQWDASNLDTFQTLYTLWNLKLNSAAGPRVAFGLNDPRNAGAFETYDCWMSEPQYKLSQLFVRAVEVTFTTAIPGT